ncbi:hypothetical protein BGZ79_001708 [Entomortierella chlamydospora]|nr:hypothetical protein BGZ79_001708 [Entomortierella chlamydospora]
MSLGNQGNHRRSARDIYDAFSRLPFEIEFEYKFETNPADTVSSGIKGGSQKKLMFKQSDHQTIDLHTVETASATKLGVPMLLTRLIITSSVTTLPTSEGSIHTIEISIDPTSISPTQSSSRPITLQSLRASVNVPLGGKALFANGYQSWSTSYAGADESSVFEKPNWLYNQLTHLGLASDMHIYDYPGVKGKVHSNLFTVIRDKCFDVTSSIPKDASFQGGEGPDGQNPRPEEVVLCGSLSEDYGYTYFLMDTNKDRFTIMQDCVGKQLRTANDKLVLRTFFAWGSKETLVWDAYADAWKSFYEDRRLIKSSLHQQLSGWTSWYCHYENINEHIILENLGHFSGPGYPQLSGWPAKVFQIDDGYTVVGDWLDCNKEKFPRGMAAIAESIRNKGLLPGLWLAPFLASKKSNIVKEHPEWFIRKPTADDMIEKQHKQFRRQSLCCCCVDFGLHHSASHELMLAHPAFSGAYALDLENPDVQAHLANVFRVVTQEWGFKMLKLDFLFAAALVARNGKTRGQLMWESMQLVRTWAGPETILLGCGVPLGASFMLVDYCRIGCDVGAGWDTMQRHFHDREYISCFNSLTSTLSRWALSSRFFGNDPDVFFIRDWNMGLNATEKRTLMILNHLLGHLVFCSDSFDFSRLNHEQKATLNSFFPWPSTPNITALPHKIVRVLQPLPTQKDVYTIQVQAGENSERTFIVFTNLSSRRQHVHFSAMERIVAKDISENTTSQESTLGVAVYIQTETSQFGLSTAAYTIKPRETCIFLRVIDSNGRLCGPCATLFRPGYTSVALDGMDTSEHVHLLATTGGHVLPTTEIQSFKRHAIRQHELVVVFRPCVFQKTIKVWLAWRRPANDKPIIRDKPDIAKEALMLSSHPSQLHPIRDKPNIAKGALTLNGHPLQLHPELLVGSGICVASCMLHISP